MMFICSRSRVVDSDPKGSDLQDLNPDNLFESGSGAERTRIQILCSKTGIFMFQSKISYVNLLIMTFKLDEKRTSDPKISFNEGKSLDFYDNWKMYSDPVQLRSRIRIRMNINSTTLSSKTSLLRLQWGKKSHKIIILYGQ